MQFIAFLGLVAIIVFGAVLIASPNTVDRIDSGGLQPGDTLYPLDQWMERIEKLFADTDRERAEQALENASERLQELTEAAKRNDASGIQQSGGGLSRALQEAVERTHNITEPAARKALQEATERITVEAEPVINDLSAKLEAETQKALETALDTMRQELDAVFERLKDEAEAQVRQEMTELRERLKQQLKDQLQQIGENVKTMKDE